MWAMAIPAAISAGTAIYNALSNKSKESAANKALQQTIQNRAAYRTPGEISQIQSIAERQAGGDMPGYSVMKDTIAGNTALGSGAISRYGGDVNQTLGAVTNLYAKNTNATNDLALKNAQYKSNSLNQLKNALQLSADYADKGWDWNTKQAYEEAYNRLAADRAAYSSAANQSLQGGINGLSSLGSSLIQAYAMNPSAFGANNNIWSQSLPSNPPLGGTGSLNFGRTGIPMSSNYSISR